METTGGGIIDNLKIKKMAKPQAILNIKLKHGNVVPKVGMNNEPVPAKIGLEDEPVAHDELGEKKKMNINIVDKRGEVEINRDLIMSRINKYVNFRVVEDESVRQKQDYKEEFMQPIVNNNMMVPRISTDEGVTDLTAKVGKMTIQDKIGEQLEKEEKEDKDNANEIGAQVKELERKIDDAIDEIEKPLEEAPELPDEELLKKKRKKAEPAVAPAEADADKEAKLKRKTKKLLFGNADIDPNVKIGNKLLSTRLPAQQPLVVRTSNYYMNNRKLYINKIAQLFAPYRDELINKAAALTCQNDNNNAQIDFKLLTHQKVVRDYLNLYTPYRGLLLYHGLGSGKTCTSIAISEGMKSGKPVVLLIPKALKTNFFNELKKCGDVMYKKTQYWGFVPIKGHPEHKDILSKVLHLPGEWIEKNGGAWLVDASKSESNYEKLTNMQKKMLDEQLDRMIESKYMYINYKNGITKRIWEEITESGTKNPFDNVTVLIDEAHNFIGNIANKIRSGKKDSIIHKVYENLMNANNAKIVCMTGTPLINYPNEMAILFNILRGYIKKWDIPLSLKADAPSSAKLNESEIMRIFRKEKLDTFDFVEYTGNTLSITRNPFGFVNVYNDGVKGGNAEDETVFTSIKNIIQGGAGGHKKKTEKKMYASNKKGTQKIYPNQPQYEVANGMVKPLAGIQDIEVNPDALLDTNRPFDDPHKGGDAESVDYKGVRLDETGNISDQDFVRQVKHVLGRYFIEVKDKKEIKPDLIKALPDDADTFNDIFIDQSSGKMKNDVVFKKRILGLSSYYRSAEEQLMPSFVKTSEGENYHLVYTEMSDYQFTNYEKNRKAEIKSEMDRNKLKNKKGDLYDAVSSYKISSRTACNFAFPDPPGRPTIDQFKKGAIKEDNVEEDISAIDGEPEESDGEEEVPKNVEQKEIMKEYRKKIKEAMHAIEYKPDRPEEAPFLLESNLGTYSSKLLKLLQNVKDESNKGLHLIYSQFRTVEGIGMVRLVLMANGYAEFKIKKNSNGEWEMEEDEHDVGKPKFVLYTGTEEESVKEIVRNVYNGNWQGLAAHSKLVNRLKEISSNNKYGEIIKVFMITSAAAEGINLKNTRFVHILESYWHMARIEQVIGRARRICSHQDLEKDEQNVKVFFYLTRFSEEQKTNKKSIEMMNRDTSRINGKPVTSDEMLFEIAYLKDKINKELLASVKETAIDCSLFNSLNKDENLVCYGFGKVTTNAFGSYPTLQQDMGQIDEPKIERKIVGLKKTKPIDGVTYAFDPATLIVYDYDSYLLAKEGRGEIVAVGKFEKKDNGFVFKKNKA